MEWIVALFIIGTAIAVTEFFIPGFIMIPIGSIFYLGAAILGFVHYGLGGALGCLVVAAVLIAAVLWLEFRVFPSSRYAKVFRHETAQVGASQPAPATADIVGSEGEALTQLYPSGFVTIQGRQYQARCRSGYIEKGERVRVAAVTTFEIEVVRT